MVRKQRVALRRERSEPWRPKGVFHACDQSTSSNERYANQFRNGPVFFWLEVLAVIFTILGIFFAGFGLYTTGKEIERSRNEARRSQTVDAWQSVAAVSPGNSGKVQALEFLAQERVPLTGIDISCKRMGGEENALWTLDRAPDGAYQPPCVPLTYLRGLFRTHSHLTFLVEEQGEEVGVILRHANLNGVDMTGAVLDGHDLFASSFVGSELTGVSFIDASLGRADFSRSYILNTVFSGASMQRAVFRSAAVRYANFSNAVLVNAVFSGADFRGPFPTSFENANLQLANFSDTDLDGLFFDGAKLIGTDFSNTTFNPSLVGSTLQAVNFFGANLSNADFSDAQLHSTSMFNMDESWSYVEAPPIGLPGDLHPDWACKVDNRTNRRGIGSNRSDPALTCAPWGERHELE